jgi:hypothetical protein
MNEFIREYRHIKKQHWEAERKFFARINLPPSITRVFKPGTKRTLFDELIKVDIKQLKTIRSQKKYKEYFEKNLNCIARVIRETNMGNNRVNPGYKWGHSTKILCLFLRDTVLHSRYFSDSQSERLSKYLYVPIDSVVIKKLRKIGYKPPFNFIKEIDSSKKFYDLQDTLGKASDKVGIPRIWFDDIWAERF